VVACIWSSAVRGRLMPILAKMNCIKPLQSKVFGPSAP